MKHRVNSSEPIDDRVLCAFYTHAVLPQFGIKDVDVSWSAAKIVTPYDEAVYRLEAEGKRYALVFEDYDGHGRNDDFIREQVLTDGETYEFVPPTSQSGVNPSYDGFHLPAPCMYCPYVTGSYTLLRIM